MKRSLFTLLISTILLCVAFSLAFALEAIDPGAILEKANIDNGESIYLTGKRKGSAALAFTGGPNWLHVEGGGCVECHGKRGWGNYVPTFCNTKSGPITYKYLAGDGYPESMRKDGRYPAYTMFSFKVLMRTGEKPTGYEADFCMPRYMVTSEELRDIMGYLIWLDKD